MKKFLSILMAVLLVCSLSATACADNFVRSVSNESTLELVSATNMLGNDVSDKIHIISYQNRGFLNEEMNGDMVAAFAALKGMEDLHDLNDETKSVSEDTVLAISDLFAVVADEDVVFPVKLVLKSQDVDKFSSMQKYAEGEFEWIVANVEDGNINMATNDGGVFAILLSLSDVVSPQTGSASPWPFIAVAVVLAGAGLVFFFKSRRPEIVVKTKE